MFSTTEFSGIGTTEFWSFAGEGGGKSPRNPFSEAAMRIGALKASPSDDLLLSILTALIALSEAVKADHGFNVESKAIRELIEVLSEYDAPTRRAFLQFITGSPKLPIGGKSIEADTAPEPSNCLHVGFRGLNPPLTVVRKPHEAPLTADDYLPSVMTCVNYLKLPEYSSRAVMKEKLQVAMLEGVGSFHLS